MPEVTNELMFELLKCVHHEIGELRQDVTKRELSVMRGHVVATQSDIYGILARQDDRFERIERRLDPRELAEAQRPYEPK
ncbi:hypothetical protein [Mesorhizobium sp. Cs1321R2N1]|uniref:hypothetical protein n=1 Tax=Mesorhizobium sp. Cs1321R2N1 TaxID=3015174 RepID=UPI00301CD5CC